MVVTDAFWNEYLNDLRYRAVQVSHDGLENGADVRAYPPPGYQLSLAAASELACILSQFRSATLEIAVDQNFDNCAVWSLFRRMRKRPGPKFTHNNLVLLRVPNSVSGEWLCREARILEERLLAHQLSETLISR